MNVLGAIDILVYIIIWITITIIGVLASIVTRIRLVKFVSAGYVPKKVAIFENYIHLFMIAMFVLVFPPFRSLSANLPLKHLVIHSPHVN